MSTVISEGLEYIGRIDDDGYIFDRSGNCMANINDSGYIIKVGGGHCYGKIDDDGTIRDASGSAVGRLQADGYVYIHSERICKVSSKFIERITPNAWNAGQPSSYSGRNSGNRPSLPSFDWPFGFGTTVKLIIGVILGIWCIIEEAGNLGFTGCLLAIPFCVAFVFLLCFIIKLFNH